MCGLSTLFQIQPAHAIKTEAERKLGQMLDATPRATGGDAQRTRWHKSTESPQTLEDLGLDKELSRQARCMAALSDAQFVQVRDGAITLTEARRQQLAALRPAQNQDGRSPGRIEGRKGKS